jgi:hypothetical protein
MFAMLESKSLWLRCAAAGISTYGMVLLYFRRKIQDAPELEEDVEPASLLRDK